MRHEHCVAGMPVVVQSKHISLCGATLEAGTFLKVKRVSSAYYVVCRSTTDNHILVDPKYLRRQPQEDVDNVAVDVLAQAMKAKLAKKREQGYSGWVDCDSKHLSQLLREHVDKGDPVDVANFCAFLLSNGDSIST